MNDNYNRKKDTSTHGNNGPAQSAPIGNRHEGAQRAQGISYLNRKAEKLTTALYMVTDFLSEREPLKWKAREAGVELLSDIAFASTVKPDERLALLRTTLRGIERIVSLIEIAASAKMITEMNADVLKKEYLHLKDNVEAECVSIGSQSRAILNERFFDVPRLQEIVERNPQAPEPVKLPEFITKEKPVEQIHAQDYVAQRVEQQQVRTDQSPDSAPRTSLPVASSHVISPPLAARVTPPAHLTVQAPRTIIKDREVTSHARNSSDRDDRRKIILALLKQKPSVIVGDIAKSIPGVSEKTIQRELLAMVDENILVKNGERRWSTYSLNVA